MERVSFSISHFILFWFPLSIDKNNKYAENTVRNLLLLPSVPLYLYSWFRIQIQWWIRVVGDSGCGKTCLISRYVHSKFDFKAKATIAWEYALKLYDIGDSTIRLNIWDIAGQDSVGGINKLFWRQAAGALVVWDLTDQETLENAVRWKKRMDELWTTWNGDFPVVLVCNKYDLVMEYERDNQIEDYMTQK